MTRRGARGQGVRRIQNSLAVAGYDPGLVDGIYGAQTEAAVRAFQAGWSLGVTGEVDRRTLTALAWGALSQPADSFFALEMAVRIFPEIPGDTLSAYLPLVVQALRREDLGDRSMVLMALATIRAEAASFQPLAEFPSKFNTDPGAHPFSRYDRRADLGNQGSPDGERYRGRGFVQLTGRDNYRRLGARLGLDLEANPDQANEPDTAARILAAFLKERETSIREALRAGDLKQARRLVNGGTHGFDRFRQAWSAGSAVKG